jgi:hypothetical protein
MSGRDEMESRVTRALEREPSIAIPEDFAMRVAALVPKRNAAVLREMPASYMGSRMAVVAAGLLLVAMFVLARMVGANATMGWLEVGLAIEFAGLTAWLGLRRVMRL